MTVKGLIAKLETYNPSMAVVVCVQKDDLPYYVKPDIQFVDHNVVVIFPGKK